MSILEIFFDPTRTVALFPDGYYVGTTKQGSWRTGGNTVTSSFGVFVPEESEPEKNNVITLSRSADIISGTSSSVRTNLDTDCGFVLALATGVAIDFGATINFNDGGDFLYGTGNAMGVFLNDTGALITGAVGIINAGTTLMGNGSDQITGFGNATSVALAYENLINGAVGAGIINIGTINAGNQSDTINGTGAATLSAAEGCSLANAAVAAGVFNVGLIELGQGNNRLIGSATATATQAQTFSFINGAVAAGVFNGLGILQNEDTFPYSTIKSSGTDGKIQEINGTASAVLTSVMFDASGTTLTETEVLEYGMMDACGNAVINGAVAAGIWNGLNNVINLLNGAAHITGTASAQATAVNTAAECVDATLAAGIFNAGSLTTGGRDDVITGQATTAIQWTETSFDLAAGILNVGLISTGNGRDTLDAMIGGFKGNGTANLGNGHDTVIGFGGGYFNGGTGTDLLTLNSGDYQVGATADEINPYNGISYFTITNTCDNTEMYVIGFESVSTNLGVVNFAAGLSFTV